MRIKYAASALVALLSGCGDNVSGPSNKKETVVDEGFTDEDGRIVFTDTRTNLEIPIAVVDSSNGGSVTGAYIRKTELSHPGYGDFLYFSVEDTTGRLLPNFYFLDSRSLNGNNSILHASSMAKQGEDTVFGLFDSESMVKSFFGKLKDYFSLYLKTRLFDPAICSRQQGDVTIFYDGTYPGNDISGASVIESGANRVITTVLFSSLDELVEIANLPENIDRIVSVISNAGSYGTVGDYIGQIPGIGPALDDSLTGHVWDTYRREEKKLFGIDKEVHRAYRVSLPPRVLNSSVDVGDSVVVEWDSYDARQYADGSSDLTVECLPDEAHSGSDLVSRVRLINTIDGEDYVAETSGNRASFKVPAGNYLASLDVRDEVGNDDFVDLGGFVVEQCETEYRHDAYAPSFMLQHTEPLDWAFAVHFELPNCSNPELVGFSFVDAGYAVYYVDYKAFLGYNSSGYLLDLRLLLEDRYTSRNFPTTIEERLHEPVPLQDDFYLLINGLNSNFWISATESGDFESSNIFLESDSLGRIYSHSPFNYRIRAIVECCD